MKKIRWTLNIAAIVIIAVSMGIALTGYPIGELATRAVISAFALCLIVSSGLLTYTKEYRIADPVSSH